MKLPSTKGSIAPVRIAPAMYVDWVHSTGIQRGHVKNKWGKQKQGESCLTLFYDGVEEDRKRSTGLEQTE